MISKDNLLSKISPRDIFLHYMNLMGHPSYIIGRNVRSPFRADKHPSFGIYKTKAGAYRFKDFAGDSGDCFAFATLYYEVYCSKVLDFNETLKAIAYEFNIKTGFTGAHHKRQVVIPPEIRKIFEKIDERTVKLGIVNYTPSKTLSGGTKGLTPEFIATLGYTDAAVAGMNYLAEYGIYNNNNPFDADDIHTILDDITIQVVVNGTVSQTKYFCGTKDSPLFLFKPYNTISRNNDNFRLYQPLADKALKHYGNVNESDIYMPKSIAANPPEILILTSGYKDALAISYNTPFAGCALGGEGWRVSDDVYNRLVRSQYFYIAILYDNDVAGLSAAEKKLYLSWPLFHTGMFEPELQEFPDGRKVKDVADYIKLALLKKMDINETELVKQILHHFHPSTH